MASAPTNKNKLTLEDVRIAFSNKLSVPAPLTAPQRLQPLSSQPTLGDLDNRMKLVVREGLAKGSRIPPRYVEREERPQPQQVQQLQLRQQNSKVTGSNETLPTTRRRTHKHRLPSSAAASSHADAFALCTQPNGVVVVDFASCSWKTQFRHKHVNIVD